MNIVCTIETSYGEANYFLSTDDKSSIEMQIDNALADICFCDAYVISSYKEVDSNYVEKRKELMEEYQKKFGQSVEDAFCSGKYTTLEAILSDIKWREEKKAMMTAKECAEAWKKVVSIYNATREETPKSTINGIIEVLGEKKTEEVFATVAAIKKHDGRIYGKNREYMNSIPVDPEIVEWRSGNPVIYAGLDDIHTSHINQLITELRCRR